MTDPLSSGTDRHQTTDPSDTYVQEIIWTRLASKHPSKKGRYRIRNGQGYESIGHYFPDDPDPGWVTMDFDGSIDYWAELNS